MAVVAAALAVSQVSRLGLTAVYVVGGVLVVSHLALWIWGRHSSTAEPGLARYKGPLTISWLILGLLPAHNFAIRSSADAVNSIGIQPVIELVVFMTIAVLAVLVIRTTEPTLDLARPPWMLVLVPVWAVASSSWSPVAPYAFARGVQFLMIMLLAWATIALGRLDPGTLSTITEGVLRWYVRVVAVLVVVGFAFGPLYVRVSAENASRFTWIGAHPNDSGLLISVAIVIAFATPSRILRLPPVVHIAVTSGLLFAMFRNHSRAAWLCLALGLLVVLFLKGRLLRLVRWVGNPMIAAGVVAAIYLRGPEIWDYILRDRDADNLATGNGRRGLWTIGFRSLDTFFDWVFGLGYGVTRTLFLEEAPWASHAHNSVLAFLVSLGVVGVALLIGLVLAIGLRLLSRRAWAVTDHGTTMLALLVLLIVNGMATDILAEPTIGYVLLNLIAVYAVVAPVTSGAEPPGPEGDDPRHLKGTAAVSATDRHDRRFASPPPLVP